ncbi:lactonase family protein [Pseudoalteromonas aurantia]|uniref:Hemolysin n=1 Tax=Pseudoalteromonas aurantia TaxID=43654 RepID=A0ABY2VW01_9GAMM|nr:lactonase family protein [Pseudoalteromonas aurantia]TMO73318.1 hypothetical protein CWC20_13460 [Pseudoalteromonas aurantia]
MTRTFTKTLLQCAVVCAISVSTGTLASDGSGCLSGLIAIDRTSNSEQGSLYHLDTTNQTYALISGTTTAVSNVASFGNTIYMMEKVNSNTRASKLYAFDLSTGQQRTLADTTSYTIKRSAMSPDGSYLLATSQTYMYQLDAATGVKTAMGKMQADDASYADFKHGDIAYSNDGNIVYVLNAKSLYMLNENDMTLDKIGEHGLNWASGLAIGSDGTLYVSERNANENAKIYTLDVNTAQAGYLVDGPRHMADLTYVSGCGNRLISIDNLYRDGVNAAHQYYLDNALTGAVANVEGFRDGSFNFNAAGFPVESKDQGGNHNKITKHPNANRCARMWNNFLDHQYTLNQSGAGGKKADGTTKWYYSTADGAYKVVSAQNGLCTYSLNDDASMRLVYDSTIGDVSVTQD